MIGKPWATTWEQFPTRPFERSRSHGRRLRVLRVEALSSIVCFHDTEGVIFGRCSIFGMLTVEPCSSLLPVERRFKFQ